MTAPNFEGGSKDDSTTKHATEPAKDQVDSSSASSTSTQTIYSAQAMGTLPTTSSSTSSSASSSISSSVTSSVSQTTPFPISGKQTNSPASSPEGKSVNSGAIAGSLIGGLAVGALIGLLFAFIIIRRKYNSRLAAHKKQLQRDQIEQGADGFSDKDVTQTLIYADPTKDNQIKEYQKRIKTLENERNAASAFGDKLDRKSEKELLNAQGYGLCLLNENINQLAMTFTVKSSGCGRLGMSQNSTERSEQISKLYSRGPNFLRDNFEDCIRHAINGTLYDRIAVPFCFEASEQGRSAGYNKIAKEVLRDNDQAMYARWRSMTHSTLRISAERKAKQTQISALKQVENDLTNTIIDIILYAGMEPNVNAASKVTTNVQSRIGELVKQCSVLIKIIREEMSTNDYALEIIPSSSDKLTKSIGLSAKTKTDAISRILLEPIAAQV